MVVASFKQLPCLFRSAQVGVSPGGRGGGLSSEPVALSKPQRLEAVGANTHVNTEELQ